MILNDLVNKYKQLLSGAKQFIQQNPTPAGFLSKKVPQINQNIGRLRNIDIASTAAGGAAKSYLDTLRKPVLSPQRLIAQNFPVVGAVKNIVSQKPTFFNEQIQRAVSGNIGKGAGLLGEILLPGLGGELSAAKGIKGIATSALKSIPRGAAYGVSQAENVADVPRSLASGALFAGTLSGLTKGMSAKLNLADSIKDITFKHPNGKVEVLKGLTRDDAVRVMNELKQLGAKVTDIKSYDAPKVMGIKGKDVTKGRLGDVGNLEKQIHPDDLKTLQVDREIEGWSDAQYKKNLRDMVDELKDFQSGASKKAGIAHELQQAIFDLRRTEKEMGKTGLTEYVLKGIQGKSDVEALAIIKQGQRQIRDGNFAKQANVAQPSLTDVPPSTGVEIPKGGVTKGVQTPLQSTLPETTQPSTKALLNPEVPTTPKPVLQTARIEGKGTTQNQQSLDSIISEGRKQIKTGGAKEDNRTFRQAVSDLYTQWVDRYNPIVKASQQAKQVLKTKGASLRPEYDPEYLVRRLTGAGGIADQRFQTELKPIIDQVDQLKINKLDLDTYLANKRIAGFGTAGRDIYGADPKKAQGIVSALETKYGENIKGIAEKLYAYQDKGLSEMSDFISPEAMAAMRKQNPDYSPLYRAMDDASDYLGLPTQKTMQGSQPIQKIKGSTRQIESPLESIIGNTFTQRAAIEKNRVAKAIVGLQNVSDLGFKKVGKEGYKTMTVKGVNGKAEFRKVLLPTSQLPKDTIVVWNNGKKEAWYVGEEIADVAKGANEENMNIVLKVIQAPAALLRQGATGRNPEFMLPNIMRDQLDAGITSRYGYIPFVDFVSGLKSMISNDEVYKRWAQSGAKIDLGSMSGKKSIKAMFDEKTAKKGLFSWIGKGLDVLGKYSEQPTRVGLFKRAFGKTGNEMLAAMESRDATVDFARMGSKMKVANSIIPFLNVGVQGFDKLIRAVQNNPGKVAVLAGIYGAAPQITSTIYNLQNFPQEYAEIPQYEKDSNFVLVKGRNERGNVDYVTIPKGNVLPVIANPIQSFLEYAHGVDGQSFSKMAMNVLSDALPVISPGGSAKEITIKTIGSNIPQAVKPIAETLLNKSFYKYDPNKEQSKDIVPYFLQNRPAYKQTYEFTPQMYQKIGAVVNVSPLQVQNIMEGYLAGYSKIPAQIIDMMTKVSRGEDVETNDKTILRRFIKETYPSSAKPAPKPIQSPNLMERITGKASAAGPIDKPLEDWQIQDEKYKLKQSDKKYSEVGNTIFYKKSNGDIGQADITKQIVKPQLTGNTELDKKLVSKYKSELTRQASDIVDLYEAGKLDKDTTEKMLKELKGKALKTGGKVKRGKKPSFKIKAVKFPKLKLAKIKKIKVPRPKKQKNYTLKVPKIKKMKVTGRLSV